ncbi:MAG: EamA family transporter [Acidimicrobiales bacterium]
MGYVFGLASAVCFASGSILFKIGQRSRPNDDGHLLANLMNTAIFGLIALFVTWQPWSTSGFLALVAGGIAGTVFGRFSMLRGIRLVGPTRANTFQTATPVSAAVAGWIALGQNVELLEAIGGAVTIFGLVRIIRSRGDGSGFDGVTFRHYVIASGAPLFFGIAFVLRKWGLDRLPGSVTGAFIGSAAGFLLLMLWEGGHGRLGHFVRRTVAHPPWHFLAAGVITSAALLTQFRSLELIDAWIVGILGGTTAIWTPILSASFLREERLSLDLLANIALVFTGVAIIAIV